MTIYYLKKILDVVAIPFKRISSDAKVLLKDFPTSAGYDLYPEERKTFVSHGRELIKTDLCLEIPKGYYGRVVRRSLLNLLNIIPFLILISQIMVLVQLQPFSSCSCFNICIYRQLIIVQVLCCYFQLKLIFGQDSFLPRS